MADNETIRKQVLTEGHTENLFLDDNIIENAMDDAMSSADSDEKKKTKAMKGKLSKKRKETNKVKSELGIRKSKQSKYPTRAHSFLGKPISDRAIHVVLNHERSEVYKDGADFCPRILMGIPAFDKVCKKNAFEHLITVQEKIKTARGEDPNKAPKWIIINNDTSMIMDRNLLSRLDELKPTTAVAGAYGFQNVRASGKWYQIESAQEQQTLRGCYVQANMENTSWDFIVGHNFKQDDRMRILIVHSPFIAVRGNFFMGIDFSEMAENVESGFFHYMADISMECHKKRLYVAQIKTVSAQFENINGYKEDEKFLHDQSYFTSKWQGNLPASITDFNIS